MDLAEMTHETFEGVAQSLGFSVQVNTNSRQVFEYYLDTSERSIPDFTFSSTVKGPSDLRLSITEVDAGNEIGLFFHGKEISLRFTACRLWRNDLEFILLYLFSHLYLRKNVVLTHAVGLRSPEDIGIMITGEAGSGKSITSLRLLQRGYQTLGNDRLLLNVSGKITMVGGTRPIRLRSATVNRYFPELGKGSDGWGTFRPFLPAELGIQESGPTPLDLLVFAKVAPVDRADCTCHEFTELHGEFTLVRIYQLLSFFSDPSQLVMISTKSIYPAFEGDDLSRQLLTVASRLGRQAAIYEVYGNLEWTVGCIESLARGLGGGKPTT